MSDEPGWRPLSKPDRRSANSPGEQSPDQPVSRQRRTDSASRVFSQRLNTDGSAVVTPFVRLARTHAFHAAGDAIVAIALAGSLFFSIDPSAARSRVLLYLVCTLAPFALVGPVIGPTLDRMRGGQRLMIIITLAARAVLMVLMIPNIDSLWLFPIAFAQLVLGKTYSIAKAATVPTTVESDDELVDKNARLAVLSALSGFVGAAPALALQSLFGSSITLGYAFIIYIFGLTAALKLPRVAVRASEISAEELDMRSTGIRLAASAMSILRGVVGFMFFMLAFAFRGGADGIDLSGAGGAAGAAVKQAMGFELGAGSSEPAWKLGLPLAFWGVGILVGNVVAPRVRERVAEERMILGGLAAIAAAAVAAVWAGGLNGAVLLAFVVGSAPSVSKLAFDSVVQRDAPGANQGATFGRFETRFQIAWVLGALVPVVLRIPLRLGFVVVAAASIFAAVTYYLGSRAVRQGVVPENLGSMLRRDRSNSTPARQPAHPGADGGPATDPAAVPPPGERPGTPHTHSSTNVRSSQADDLALTQDRSRFTPQSAPTIVQHAIDPYADAFAESTIEPPHWVNTPPVGQPDSASGQSATTPWLRGHRADYAHPSQSGADQSQSGADQTPTGLERTDGDSDGSMWNDGEPDGDDRDEF